jgi:spore maturation protein A
MLKYIWSFMIVGGFLFGIINGKAQETTKAIMDGAVSGISVCIGLAGVLCLWSGVMEIADRSGITALISKITIPLISFLYPEIPKNHPAATAIVMNMTANILGLGNAATPLGIKAMEELHKLNKNKSVCSNSMIMLLVVNTSMIQLVPATIVAVRSTAGSRNPADVTVPIWIASLCASIVGITIVKILNSNSRDKHLF